ncbi:hypothetical protein, partial [Streptomyces sp. PRh5]|uniref:hypothetical protein n=1 Tax=Streptomyces sp. PRh5 TaxID=1158056 RepID=UPI000568E56F
MGGTTGTTGATVPKRRESHEHGGYEPAGPPAHATDDGTDDGTEAGGAGAGAAPPAGCGAAP